MVLNKEVETEAEGAGADAGHVAEKVTTTELTVIRLTSPMTLAAGTELLVACDVPIEVAVPLNPLIMISSHTSTPITAIGRVTISPYGPLGPVFARRWTKLPTELKLQVLRHNLVFQ
jgi:hypothetical protein